MIEPKGLLSQAALPVFIARLTNRAKAIVQQLKTAIYNEMAERDQAARNEMDYRVIKERRNQLDRRPSDLALQLQKTLIEQQRALLQAPIAASEKHDMMLSVSDPDDADDKDEDDDEEAEGRDEEEDAQVDQDMEVGSGEGILVNDQGWEVEEDDQEDGDAVENLEETEPVQLKVETRRVHALATVQQNDREGISNVAPLIGEWTTIQPLLTL